MYRSSLLIATSLLITWSFAFIVLSLIKRKHLVRGTVEAYTWSMHRIWAIVNIIIVAICGLLIALNWQALGYDSTLQFNLVLLVALNIWFDVIYVLVGLSLRKANQKHSGRIQGYGKAIFLQGLFLLALDAVLLQLLMRSLDY